MPAGAAFGAFFTLGFLGGIGLDTLFGDSPDPTMIVWLLYTASPRTASSF
jgi:hypothetical protein